MLLNQRKAFDNFYQSARHNTVLSGKTSLLVHLGASMAVGCYPCIRFYMDQVDKEGVSDEEINAVESIVMAVSAGRIREQFREAISGRGACEEEENGCR